VLSIDSHLFVLALPFGAFSVRAQGGYGSQTLICFQSEYKLSVKKWFLAKNLN
jgi:hypothetical protein